MSIINRLKSLFKGDNEKEEADINTDVSNTSDDVEVISSQIEKEPVVTEAEPVAEAEEAAVEEGKHMPFFIDNQEAALLIWFFGVTQNEDTEGGYNSNDDVPNFMAGIKDLHIEGMLFLRVAAFKKEPLKEEKEEEVIEEDTIEKYPER